MPDTGNDRRRWRKGVPAQAGAPTTLHAGLCPKLLICLGGPPPCPPSSPPPPSLPPNPPNPQPPPYATPVLHYPCRYGKVADPEVADKNTEALRELNAFLLRDERVAFSLVPVGDGIALCTVR